jgi:hypothetical protein
MKKSVACLGLSLGLALSSNWAASKLEPPPLEQYLRWGPLRVRPGIELSDVGYDDNILYTDQNKVSDYTATVSPKLEALLLLGDSAFLQLSERLDFTFYLENTDQNYDNARSAARFTFPLRRIGFFTDLIYNRANLRPIDLEQIRTERTEKKLGAGVIFTPNWRTELEFSQSTANLSYDDPGIAFRQDRDERTTSIDASYRVMGQSSILLTAMHKKIDFDSPFVVDDLVIPRDTVERRLVGGLGFGEGGRLTGSFRLGWGTIDAEDPLLQDLSELIGDAELVYRAGSRTKLLLEALRLPGFSVFQANAYYLETSGGLRAVRYINRLWGVEAGGRIGKLTFPSSLDMSNREDDILRYEVGVRLRVSGNSMGRRVEYSFRIGRYRRESTVESQNQTRNTAGFGAVVGF